MALRTPRGGNAPSRVATADELDTFTDDELDKGSKIIPFPCGKCGGSGRWGGTYSPMGGVCFGCNGAGKVNGRLYTPRKRVALDKANEKREQRKQEKRQQKRNAALAESLKTYPDAHRVSAEILDYIEAHGLDSAEDHFGGFIVDVSRKIEQYGATEAQATSLVSAYNKRKDILDKRAEDKARLVAAPDGRQTITGEVVHATIRDTVYGTTWKMIVLDDRQFKVWSTVPKAIIDEVPHVDALKGARVTYTGTLEVSDKDETFAFAKRPSNARILEPAKSDAA